VFVAACTAFGGDDPTPAPPGDAGANDASAAGDSGPADATPSADSQVDRTGVICGSGGGRCAVGERCCIVNNKSVCAPDCSKLADGASAEAYHECGQPSDCPDPANSECCFHHSGNNCGDNYCCFDNSRCVAKGNCNACGGDASPSGFERGCDPTRKDECPGGKTCTVNYRFWTLCAR
jgi:hypothetical protein